MVSVILAFSKSLSFFFSTGEWSSLHADGCWLIRVLVAEGWAGCSNFLKYENNEVCQIDGFFIHNCSTAVMLVDSILHVGELPSKWEVGNTNLDAAFSAKFTSYSKSSAVVSTIFTASSPRADSISRNLLPCHPQKATPHLLEFYPEMQQFSHVFSPTSFFFNQSVVVQSLNH